jgi:hypothetical protein
MSQINAFKIAFLSKVVRIKTDLHIRAVQDGTLSNKLQGMKPQIPKARGRLLSEGFRCIFLSELTIEDELQE